MPREALDPRQADPRGARERRLAFGLAQGPQDLEGPAGLWAELGGGFPDGHQDRARGAAFPHLFLEHPALAQEVQELGVKPVGRLPAREGLQPAGQGAWVRARHEAHAVLERPLQEGHEVREHLAERREQVARGLLEELEARRVQKRGLVQVPDRVPQGVGVGGGVLHPHHETHPDLAPPGHRDAVPEHLPPGLPQGRQVRHGLEGQRQRDAEQDHPFIAYPLRRSCFAGGALE